MAYDRPISMRRRCRRDWEGVHETGHTRLFGVRRQFAIHGYRKRTGCRCCHIRPRCNIPVDRAKAESLGYGFVYTKYASDAERIATGLNGYVLDGRKLRASIGRARG